ncbi:hypothetical protein [Novosphingobium album (ex Hu et al. 2023)]|uniref:Uncharacterized protein n=1 Tax=Novosphingobium album (ex Hu et al. 2023) TaxID=2930093 RepID=A0ABT0B7K9_9SPHN|nr:hypothetical protein [Novosphingobium album (ex Hu et al. 2023)]MCJ2180894.1 hypothetical protein [Novosphingobium album (ex Hu et al. 2023)]
MENDVPPKDEEILALIGSKQGRIDPRELIESLSGDHETKNVIEALQRAIERRKITLDPDGMVIALEQFAEAA